MTTTTRPRFGSRRVFTVTTTTMSTPADTEVETQEGSTTPASIRRKSILARSSSYRTTTTSTTAKSLSTITSTTMAPTSSSTTTATAIQSTTVGPVPTCGQRLLDTDIHPWIAILEHSDPLNSTRRRTFSKGVLISENYVLTTVSSIHNSHPFWEV